MKILQIRIFWQQLSLCRNFRAFRPFCQPRKGCPITDCFTSTGRESFYIDNHWKHCSYSVSEVFFFSPENVEFQASSPWPAMGLDWWTESGESYKSIRLYTSLCSRSHGKEVYLCLWRRSISMTELFPHFCNSVILSHTTTTTSSMERTHIALWLFTTFP